MSDKRHRLASIVAISFDWRAMIRRIACRVFYPFASRDEGLARGTYRRFHGVEPNLSSPRGLDEKICWLKVHDRRPLLTRMSCKLEAREVVRERGFGHMLKELYNSWERAEDIEFDTLPDRFALKATHGSRQNYFHLGDRVPDRDAIIEMARGWLKINHASYFGEWGYRNIKPRLLAEELLLRSRQLGSPELRVWCFGGEPRFIRRSSGFSGTIPRKGAILPGFDADFVVVDPDREVVVDPGALESNSDYSPLEGMKLRGAPALTVLRGRVIAAGGAIDPEAGGNPNGHYLSRL